MPSDAIVPQSCRNTAVSFVAPFCPHIHAFIVILLCFPIIWSLCFYSVVLLVI